MITDIQRHFISERQRMAGALTSLFQQLRVVGRVGNRMPIASASFSTTLSRSGLDEFFEQDKYRGEDKVSYFLVILIKKRILNIVIPVWNSGTKACVIICLSVLRPKTCPKTITKVLNGISGITQNIIFFHLKACFYGCVVCLAGAWVPAWRPPLRPLSLYKPVFNGHTKHP